MEEWREVLADAWRQARDAFWDAGMGGIDWLSVHAAYESQLPRVGCTSELYDLIRRMYAELRVLHTCAYPPALAASVRSNALARPSFLGGVLRAAADGRGGVEVCELYCGDHERQQLSPLVMPHYGLPLREGERIGEINGVACHTLAALGEALLGQAAKQVRLRVWTPRGCDAPATDAADGSSDGTAVSTYGSGGVSSAVGAAVSILSARMGSGGPLSSLLSAAGVSSPFSSSRQGVRALRRGVPSWLVTRRRPASRTVM